MIVSWITVLGLIVGGIFTLIEYRHHVRSEKIERTMGYLTRFNSQDILRYRVILDRLQDSHYQAESKALLNPIKSKRKSEYDKLILDMTQPSINRESINGLMDFYDEIAICADVKVCDSDTAHALFNKDASAFFTTFSPYICDLRNKWNDRTIGAELENFFNGTIDSNSCQFKQ